VVEYPIKEAVTQPDPAAPATAPAH
jgi:hypothetical protein